MGDGGKNILKNYFPLEIPMSDLEIKYTIKKELRKLYGERATKYYSKDILNFISENLKLARKAIIKYETGQDADDLFSHEFFRKYEQEMQKLIKNCIDEIKQENKYKENAIKSIGNNVKIMMKIKDTENK